MLANNEIDSAVDLRPLAFQSLIENNPQIDSYTGSRRFRPWGQGWSGGTWEISYGHGEHSVTIFEIET